jgi:hypothetical protein
MALCTETSSLIRYCKCMCYCDCTVEKSKIYFRAVSLYVHKCNLIYTNSNSMAIPVPISGTFECLTALCAAFLY